MAEEFIARGKQAASGAGSATLNIETLATAMCSTGVGHDVTEAEGGPAQRALALVEQWNPPFCGDIGMRIARGLDQSSSRQSRRISDCFSSSRQRSSVGRPQR